MAQDIEKLSKKYQKIIEGLDTENLKLIANDFSIALKYAREGMVEVDPENLNDQNIEQVAIEMQNIAKMILRERSVN